MNRSLKNALIATLLGSTVVVGLQGCLPVVVAGAGAGALMANDRRSSGAYVDDESLEWKIESQLNDRFGDRAHINAVSFNRIVLLAGEAPDQATKEEAGRIASNNGNVRNVVNEIQIGTNSSLSSRSNDALITSKVKGHFVDAATFGVSHVKVYTEAGTVFLLGLVTHREADAATEVARTTGGVAKVVRVFEYIADDDARKIDGQAAQGQPVK